MIVVTIIYPTDPMGIVPGGTDTCIRDILRCSPDDINIRLIGVTTDPLNRPVRKWTTCKIDNSEFDFYPVLAVNDLKTQQRIPLSVKFTLKLLGCKAWKGSDILQFHRLEPALLFIFNKIPKFTVIHQNMNILNNKNSDIRWKYFPGIFYKIEDFLLPKFSKIYTVREDAVEDYQQRYPEKTNDINFLPTWVNQDVFYMLDTPQKSKLLIKLQKQYNLPGNEKLLVVVGRLDSQKDPHLLLDALKIVFRNKLNLRCIIIGDGVLKDDIVNKSKSYNITDKISLVGALKQSEVIEWMQISHMLILSSAYEGMPRCVVEALGCGLPVAATNVGETSRLVKPGINGSLASERTDISLASAIEDTLENLNKYQGEPCINAIEEYTAKNVLSNLYNTYRNQ